MTTFELDDAGLDQFYKTLDMETYVLLEATADLWSDNTFAFVELWTGKVKQALVANTYQLKSVGIASKKTDKIDATKLAEKLKAEILSGVQQIVPVTVAPKEIRDLRALFSTYRLLRKEIGQTKNRVHRTKGPPLLKENLYPFTKEYIFGKGSRKHIRSISGDPTLNFQINLLMDTAD
jgi:hypothetical protein